MTRIFTQALMMALLPVVFLGACASSHEDPQHPEAAQPATKMTIFLLQVDRQRTTLENDAVLIANTLNAAQEGDHVQAFTTAGMEIVSLAFDREKRNLLEVKQIKTRAIRTVREFFLKLFNNSATSASEIPVDVAGALALAMDRLNTAPPYSRRVLVLLSDGLQRDRAINFRGCYPSDSWVPHPLSPFAAIKANATGRPIEALLLPERTSYVNSYHAARIERWYTLLLHHKGVRLIGFTFDHQTAAQLLMRGGALSEAPKNLQAVDLNGPLVLTQVHALTTEPNETQ